MPEIHDVDKTKIKDGYDRTIVKTRVNVAHA